MPEQQGSRHLPPTASPIEQPFETAGIRFGLGGLDLRLAKDIKQGADQFNRFTNVVHEGDGELSQRPGLTLEATTNEDIHSIVRMNDPGNDTFTRLVGEGSELHMGTSSLAKIDDGYSTEPLVFCPYRPPFSGDPWVFIGDSDRNRKVRADGLVLPIGLTEPASACSVAAAAVQSTTAVEFGPEDNSDAAQWTNNSGFDYADPPNATGIPTTTDFPGFVGGTVRFKTNPTAANAAAAKGEYYFWGLPKTLDLSKVGTLPSSDDDIFHLWLKFSHPDLTAEMRIYFVVGATFSPSIFPGTQGDVANTDFYVKTWRTNDITQFIMANQAQIEAAETARVHTIRDQALKNNTTPDDRISWTLQREQIQAARGISLQGSAARDQWLEYGIIGVPLRRGDFLRVGSTASRGWDTVTGIVVYLQTAEGTAGPINMALDNMYLYGGYGPDSVEPGALAYDWRYTHYDPRTGAESNPSPEMTSVVDLARSAATLTPTPFGDSAVHQRFYRRGGALIADWYFLGENTSDGGTFFDTFSDDSIVAAGTVDLDNDAFVTSVDSAGNTIHQQTLPVIFGPDQDLLYGCGDPHRPGHVYFCKPGKPDSWPPDNVVEVCPPGEILQNGGVFAGQSFVFSRERFYTLVPSLTGQTLTVTALPTACRKGLIQRWAMTVGRGYIWFVSEDGIYRTIGGPEERISEAIQPLFQGQTVENYAPINLDFPFPRIRLEIHDHDLWFLYTDTNGDRQCMIYSIIYNYWRHYGYPVDIAVVDADEGDTDTAPLLGDTDGHLYKGTGLTDNGVAITGAVRTANLDFGRPREDKLLGDAYIDVDRNNTDVTTTFYLNHEEVQNGSQIIDTGNGRNRYILDPFGTTPQRGRTVALDLGWVSSTGGPTFFQAGVAVIPEPDVTNQRVTQWDDLGSPDEKYLTGCWLECDTRGVTRTILVEADLLGVITTVATLGVNANGRHRLSFSWPVAKANMVRIRPNDDCKLWLLYKLDWIAQPEPPRISKWDVNYENNWDVYLTGLDLDCNTFGLDKTVNIFLEETLIQTYTVNANGRKVIHLTVQPPVRGHLMRFNATDDNDGLLYAHRWHVDEEPSEQTNWNQNYTIAGALNDKYLKSILFECDTFGQDKQVEVQIDGVTVETLTVNADNRKVVEKSFPQHLGRVFRVLPVDNFPSRLYSLQWVFDQEPLQLLRWETQEIDHDYWLWEVPLYAQVTIKSTQDVTMTLTTYGQGDADVSVETYTIPSTGGIKRKRFVPFRAHKGVLFKYLFTSAEAFWLYREESVVKVSLWGTGKSIEVHPFGNDDLDATRVMTNASLASARGGGGTG